MGTGRTLQGMSDSAPASKSFNPAWLAFALSLVVAIMGVGATWKTVTSLEERVKLLEGWKSSQDVAFTEMKSDLRYIVDTVKDIRTSLTTAQQPAQVVYPQYPPNYPAQQQQPSRRQQVAPRGIPRRLPPARRRCRRPA